MRLSMTCSRFAASRILLLWLDVAIGSCKIHVAAPGSHGSESPPLSVANSHVVCLVGCGHSIDDLGDLNGLGVPSKLKSLPDVSPAGTWPNASALATNPMQFWMQWAEQWQKAWADAMRRH